MHMYNNNYYKIESNLDLRAYAYAFTEANYFDNVSYPGMIRSMATIKSWNDIYDNVTKETKVSYITDAKQAKEDSKNFAGVLK